MDAIEVRIIGISSQFRLAKSKIGSIDCGLCNKGFTKLSPDLPAGIVRFLLVDTLPCALSLNGVEITVVDPRVKLVALAECNC